MKKVLVLAGISGSGRSTPYDKYFGEHIRDYQFTQIYLDQLMVEISPAAFNVLAARTGEPILGYDMVMIREYGGHFVDLAFVIAKYLKAHNARFFNHNYLTYRPISKIAQAALFFEQKVNFPATLYSLDGEALIEAARRFDFPYILKDRLGMHGSDNHLVASEAAARTVLSNRKIKYIAQEYLPNSHDYRVLVMGGQEPIQIKRTAAPGSHLNNTSQGGAGQMVSELPQEVLSDARRLAGAFEIEIGGVDVLQSQTDGKFYFLEVNNQPQLVTGAEVPAKMTAFRDFLDQNLTGSTGKATGS